MAASNDAAALRDMAMKQYAAEEQALNDEEESDIKCEPRKQSASKSDQEPSVASRPTDAPSKPAQPLRRAASFERKTRSGRIALAVGDNKPEEPTKSGRPEGDNKPADSGQSQHMRLRRSISFDRARRNLSAGFTKNQGSSDNATGAAESDKGAAEKPTESNKAPSGRSGGRLVRSLSFGRNRSSSSSASSVTSNGAAAEPSPSVAQGGGGGGRLVRSLSFGRGPRCSASSASSSASAPSGAEAQPAAEPSPTGEVQVEGFMYKKAKQTNGAGRRRVLKRSTA